MYLDLLHQLLFLFHLLSLNLFLLLFFLYFTLLLLLLLMCWKFLQQVTEIHIVTLHLKFYVLKSIHIGTRWLILQLKQILLLLLGILNMIGNVERPIMDIWLLQLL